MPETLDPVRRAVLVPVPPERAFAAFTAEIGAWWPLGSHSVGGAEATGLSLEPRAGGRIVETIRGAEPALWGTVTIWDPPRLVAFTWHPGRAPVPATEVAVRFHAEGEGTRVELEHWGWERLDRPEASRDQYRDGWPAVLRALADRLRDGAGPPTYQVLVHRPGPAWRAGTAFAEQPGVELHIAFMRELRGEDRLVMGGPFLDADAGGMAVVAFGSLEAAERRARTDPSVAAGLLTVTVRPWLVAMGG
jgi:uncharacterized protein YciI/uncharacterized protein YndB with AHSA1/START domain